MNAQAFDRRLPMLAIIILLAAFIVGSDSLHARSEQIIALIESIIAQFPVIGMIVFVLFAVVSAMLAFFSSAIIVPIGVYAWGGPTCLLLLWLGWIIGGAVAFTLGRYFGRPVAARFVGEERLSAFENRFNQRTRFIHVLLFQAALPSEVPGYVLGTVGYPLRGYIIALALVEFPYAVGTVYLGESFLEREPERLLVVGALLLLIAGGMYYLHRRVIGRRA